MPRLPSLLLAACVAFPATALAQPAVPTPVPTSARAGDVRARIAASLDSLAASGWLSGAVLVTRGRDTLLARAYGLADRERGVPNGVDTRFLIASAGKMFTAVAIAQLVDRGAVRLADTVGRFLPEHPNATVRSRVTVAQLLSHTGGLGSYWNARYEARRTALRSSDDYIALTADDALPFAPGAGYEYSNAGFALLGGIIERASGMSYADYLTARVFQPSWMRRTGLPLLGASGAELRDVAVGYGAASGGAAGRIRPELFASAPPASQPNTQTLPGRGGAAGDAVSTVADLTAFLRAVGTGALTSAAMRDSLWTIRARPEGPRARGQAPYGYGFTVRDTPLGRAVGHPGGASARAAFAQYYPERDVTVVILANVDPLVTFEALRRIEAALSG